MSTDYQALDTVRRAFSSSPRPEHFTDFTHCEECAEHDALLLSRDVDTLALEDVGHPGWDPVCFVTEEGFVYYFPALCRLALAEPQGQFGWYGLQLAWHLILDGPRNRRFLHCSPAQRKAVSDFLAHLIETRSGLADSFCASEDIMGAYKIWSESGE